MTFIYVSPLSGISEEPPDKQESPALTGASVGVIDLMREQVGPLHSSANSLMRAVHRRKPAVPRLTSPIAGVNLLELSDTSQVTCVALEQGRLASIENATAMCKVRHCSERVFHL